MIGALLADLPNGLRHRWGALREPGVPAAYGDGAASPVLLLPGVYESWHFLRPIADALNADGHPIHVVPSLARNARPIPWTAAEALRVLRERDLRRVVVVAHSKGGIVGKHLLAIDDAEEGRVERVVAIASPFAGSRMARLVPLGALRAFVPGDPLLTRLAAETAVNQRIVSIAPRVDPHIPEGSRLDGAEYVEIDTVGHFRVLADPRTVDAVRRVVGRA
jgi:hypothetical protein